MNTNTKLSKTNQGRTESGKFSNTDYGEKKLRSVRLTDEAWELLEAKGIEQGKNRTDVIEDLARSLPEQELILSVLRRFIDNAKSNYGTNPAQKGKDFSTNTRDWSQLIKFMKMIELEPHELGIGEE